MKKWFEERHAPAAGTYLCRTIDIGDNQVKEFSFGKDSPFLFRLFIYKEGEVFRAFRNACPHYNVPLNHIPGDVFTSDGTQFLCMTHYAKFDTGTGLCTEGPCIGESLDQIPLHRDGQRLLIAEYD
ncbi:MAG: nitrite reductase/ring-hydroxylating ferredoxin subunit [Pseudohongiellaceae bacterium]|jgi:nitrite reductase/ring-hydroxylating ferredoxin subunit